MKAIKDEIKSFFLPQNEKFVSLILFFWRISRYYRFTAIDIQKEKKSAASVLISMKTATNWLTA